MEITAWDVYLVLQMDQFCLGAVVVFWIAMCLSLATAMFWGIMCSCRDLSCEAIKRKRKLAYIAMIGLVMTCLFGAIAMALPTTKTLAAIYIVPKIANSEELGKWGELVPLARQRMAELLEKDQKELKK